MVDIAALDLWTLFVHYTFGSFIFAVVCLALFMFVIMGVLGKMSIYSVFWYIGMFVLAMGLGYGYVLLNMTITVGLIMFTWFSIKSYLDTR